MVYACLPGTRYRPFVYGQLTYVDSDRAVDEWDYVSGNCGGLG